MKIIDCSFDSWACHTLEYEPSASAMDDIYIDLNFLTESERDALRDVLARDENFRRQEKKRLR